MKIELNALIEEWTSYNMNLRNLSENSVKAYLLDVKDFLYFSIPQNHAKTIPQLSQNYPETIPKLFQNYPKTIRIGDVASSIVRHRAASCGIVRRSAAARLANAICIIYRAHQFV